MNCSTRSGGWMDCRVSRIGKFYSDKEFISSTWFWIGLGWKKELTSNS